MIGNDQMLHVLLIEDNPADVLLVREALRSCSTQADSVSACDGEQGLQLLADKTFKPDLILLDLNLPKFSGLELLEHYNTQEGAPVIVLTSSDSVDDRKRAFELGAREYIQKPVGFREFIDVIHDIIDRWGSAVRPAARAIIA